MSWGNQDVYKIPSCKAISSEPVEKGERGQLPAFHGSAYRKGYTEEGMRLTRVMFPSFRVWDRAEELQGDHATGVHCKLHRQLRESSGGHKLIFLGSSSRGTRVQALEALQTCSLELGTISGDVESISLAAVPPLHAAHTQLCARIAGICC